MTIGERVLQIAEGEIGVTEYPSGSNKVKYNTWFYGREVSGSVYPWCMAFVQWCYAMAGHPLPYKTASCSGLLNWYKAYRPERIVTEPRAGDIVIYDFAHTGIVRSAGAGYITAVEGNTSLTSDDNGGAVMLRTRATTTVKAYIRPFDGEIPNKEDDKMTGEEIYKALCEYTAAQKLPDWASDEFASAVAAGITDGSDPCGLIPRYQAAIMAHRAALAAIESVKDAENG